MARELKDKISAGVSRRAFLFGRKYIEEEDGATAIEYGLMATMISLAMIVGARRLGRRANRKLRCTRNRVNRVRRGRPNADQPC